MNGDLLVNNTLWHRLTTLQDATFVLYLWNIIQRVISCGANTTPASQFTMYRSLHCIAAEATASVLQWQDGGNKPRIEHSCVIALAVESELMH